MIHRLWSLASFCLVGISLVGCGGVYHITRVTPPPSKSSPGTEKQDGVLYYVKVGVCRQETKYEEPIFDIVLTNTATKAVELQRSIGLSAYVELQAKLALPGADAKKALNDAHAYEPTDFKKPPIDGNLLLVANRNIIEAVVDYRHQYYFNAKRPISGSATADIKIGPDGSMTEASATVQSDTLKTILSAVPTQTMLSAVLGLDAGHPAYTISVTQRTYAWIASALPVPIPADEEIKQCPVPGSPLEITATTTGKYNITRELVMPTDTAKPAGAAAPPPKSN